MLLAFDTATPQVTVALHDGDSVVASYESAESMRHGEMLAPGIRRVLADANAKAADVDGFAVDLGDRVGVMRPVAHRAVCSPCHGVEEKLNPEVRKELKDRYVVDHATGFKDGDLRGWIWVEVPKSK